MYIYVYIYIYVYPNFLDFLIPVKAVKITEFTKRENLHSHAVMSLALETCFSQERGRMLMWI